MKRQLATEIYKIFLSMINFLKWLFSTKVYYFAYGSNMSLERIKKRIGYCKKISNYNLEGYKLQFNYGNSEFSFANLIESENDKVEGIVYQITLEQLFLLDYSEGCGNPNYYNRMVDLFKNKPLHFYISFNIRENLIKPLSKDYYDTLVIGANENNLVNYLKLLNNINFSENKFMYK